MWKWIIAAGAVLLAARSAFASESSLSDEAARLATEKAELERRLADALAAKAKADIVASNAGVTSQQKSNAAATSQGASKSIAQIGARIQKTDVAFAKTQARLQKTQEDNAKAAAAKAEADAEAQRAAEETRALARLDYSIAAWQSLADIAQEQHGDWRWWTWIADQNFAVLTDAGMDLNYREWGPVEAVSYRASRDQPFGRYAAPSGVIIKLVPNDVLATVVAGTGSNKNTIFNKSVRYKWMVGR